MEDNFNIAPFGNCKNTSVWIKKPDLRKKKHWFFITIYDCAECNHRETYREIRYDLRPERWGDRHEREQILCDNCKNI